MRRRPAPTARSSSRSSKRAEPTPPAAPASAGPLLSVARVAVAQGIRGALRVRPHQGRTTSLAAGRTITLRQAGTDSMHSITRVAPHGAGQLLVELDALCDRTAA